jgi:ubiquinone/menaquinone biosynthesis C-methylase UbiE
VERGHYPRELLFQIPLAEYTRALPALLRDARRTVERMRSGNYKDLPANIDMARYPAYYRRNFHWQTDGYLSEHSAALYDLGVEILFRGTADIMRRQIIPPISAFLRGQSPGSVRLLDIACGTGRTLKQLAVAHPRVRYHGTDLSPFYIRAARRLLADVGEVSLSCENAESLPYVDDHFDVITSVYLFHELPKKARRRVLDEAYRALRPGGLLVVEDSIQPSDSPELVAVLRGFAKNFHEPFYDSYLKDDLAELVRERGFEVTAQETHLVAKVVMARKPAH